jgi:hypothetical protein
MYYKFLGQLNKKQSWEGNMWIQTGIIYIKTCVYDFRPYVLRKLNLNFRMAQTLAKNCTTQITAQNIQF